MKPILEKYSRASDTRYWGSITAALLFASFLPVIFPDIDLYVSGLFYNPQEGFNHSRFLDIIHHIGPYVVLGVAVCISVILYFKKIIPVKGVLFIAGNFILGPGIIINGVLKEYFGRARPHHIEQFGGHAHFTPALMVAYQCNHNCSFSSGDPSVGFSLIAFALLLPSKRLSLTVIAFGIGTALGAMRIVQGGHFLSDVLFTALISVVTALVLYTIIFKKHT